MAERVTRALALDLSATTWGWAAHTGEPSPMVGQVELDGNGVRRMAQARDMVRVLLDRFQPEVVVVEGYSFGSKGQAVVTLGEVGGVVRLELFDRAVAWTELSPSTRMKLATGKGQASKEAVLAEAIRRLGYQGSSLDEADALWLLEAVRQAYALPGAVKLPRAHMDALDRITWPELAG